MLSDDEIERLIVSMEANTSKFDKAIAGTNERLDAILSSMEKRADTFQARFDKAMEGAGRSMRRVMEGIGISLSFEGLKRFVESVTETAMNVKKQSAAIGVSASTFQAWSIMAKKADVDQQVLNTTLERFASNIGMAQLKVTAFGKEMQKYLGPDALKGSVEDVIYRFADFMQRVQSPTQRAAMLRLAAGGTGGGGLGGGGVALAQFFGQGSASMKAQVQQLKAAGEIIPEDELEKIQKLDRAWIDLKATLSVGGAEALTGFVDGFQHLSGTVTDQRFQDGLRTVGKLLGEITKTLGSNPKIVAALTGAGVGGFLGGIPGAAIGGVLGYGGASAAEHDDPNVLRSAIANAKRQPGWQNLPAVRQNISRMEARLKSMTSGAYSGPNDIADTELSAFTSPGGKYDLSGSLTESAYDRAVQALKIRTQALRDGSGEFANYTQAQEEARVKTELMTAAEEDAAKSGGKVSAQRIADINALAAAYGREAAAKAFAKSQGDEEDRIAKLKTEAAAAGATVRQLAEMEEMERQLQNFHKAYPDQQAPNEKQLADMHKTAAEAGNAAAGDAWAKAVDQAKKEIGQAQGQNETVGKFQGALAQAQMRAHLINVAQMADVPMDQAMPMIDQLSKAFGDVVQKGDDAVLSEEKVLAATGELRNGLEEIGVAGLHGFNSMKSAAAGFVEQLAAMILKLYVLQPLMEGLLGPPGTAGGGALAGPMGTIFNGILGGKLSTGILGMLGLGGTAATVASTGSMDALVASSTSDAAVTSAVSDAASTGFFTFKEGGVMTPSGPRKLKRFAGGGMSSTAAIFGEAGPEAAVPLPDGRSIPVSLRMPMTPTVPQLPSPNVSVTYAPVNQITGNDPSTVAQVRSLIQAHEQNMPAMIHTTVTQMARRKAGPWN